MFDEPVIDEKEIGVMKQFLEKLPSAALRAGINILLALLVLWVGSLLIKWLKKIVVRTMKKANAETGVIQFVSSFISVALYIVLILLILSLFGVQAASIIALIGSAGVAIGLALQGSLSNLAGGVLILIMKPFVVGDYIIEDSNGNQGTVKEIRLFYTILQTMDAKTVIIPNGTLANTSMTNVSHSPERRLDLEVGVSYDSDLGKAKEALLEAAGMSPYLIQTKEIDVFVKSLEASSVLMGFTGYVKNGDYLTAKYDLNERILTTLGQSGIRIPYPQMDVHLDDNKNPQS